MRNSTYRAKALRHKITCASDLRVLSNWINLNPLPMPFNQGQGHSCVICVNNAIHFQCGRIIASLETLNDSIRMSCVLCN
jgi:hypothetical protein